MSNLYALFQIENEYDQPSHDLCALFRKKPTIEELAIVLGYFMDSDTPDEIIVKIVDIWKGNKATIKNTEYRLEEISDNFRQSDN